jgi:hypothetical protein
VSPTLQASPQNFHQVIQYLGKQEQAELGRRIGYLNFLNMRCPRGHYVLRLDYPDEFECARRLVRMAMRGGGGVNIANLTINGATKRYPQDSRLWNMLQRESGPLRVSSKKCIYPLFVCIYTALHCFNHPATPRPALTLNPNPTTLKAGEASKNVLEFDFEVSVKALQRAALVTVQARLRAFLREREYRRTLKSVMYMQASEIQG